MAPAPALCHIKNPTTDRTRNILGTLVSTPVRSVGSSLVGPPDYLPLSFHCCTPTCLPRSQLPSKITAFVQRDHLLLRGILYGRGVTETHAWSTTSMMGSSRVICKFCESTESVITPLLTKVPGSGTPLTRIFHVGAPDGVCIQRIPLSFL